MGCAACRQMLELARFSPFLSSFEPLTRYIVAHGRHFHWHA